MPYRDLPPYGDDCEDDASHWQPPIYAVVYAVVVGLLMWVGLGYVVRILIWGF